MSETTVVSVIINYHDEPIQWLDRAVKSVLSQKEAPDTEVIVVADKASAENQVLLQFWHDKHKDVRMLNVKNGDLGLSRNDGVKEARGKFIQFLDCDDMLGFHWLKSAYQFIQNSPSQEIILHPEYSLMFGRAQFFHRHVSYDSPEFDAKSMVQFNPWSALAFAAKSVFQRFPYEPSDDTFMNEDWAFNLTTIDAGIPHKVVPGAVHLIRMKLDGTSMAARMDAARGVQRKRGWFDRRDHKPPQMAPRKVTDIPQAVYRQALFAHHEVGERQVVVTPEMQIRVYGAGTTFDDQAWLKDQIGGAKHVVLVETLGNGGAEKYARNWAMALGDSNPLNSVIIETNPISENKEFGVIQWFRRGQLGEGEEVLALQRALIQSDLDSVFVCNSKLGLSTVEHNPKCLAKKVFVASFAVIPVPGGFTSAPPLWFRSSVGYTIVTDNERQANLLADYNGVRTIVIPPKATYDGKSKKRQINDSERTRVLWAGRGTFDKQPQLVAELAMHMPEADFHVWGEVPRVPNALPNLMYRGQFESFSKIDGTYDVYLMTSMNEGMPHSALEAAMAGLPIAAPDVGDLEKIATSTYPSQIGRPTNISLIIESIKKASDAHKDDIQHAKDYAETYAKLFTENVRSLVIG